MFEPGRHKTIRVGVKSIYIHFMDVAQIKSSTPDLVHNEIYTAGNEPELQSGKFEIRTAEGLWHTSACTKGFRKVSPWNGQAEYWIPIKDFKCPIPVRRPATEKRYIRSFVKHPNVRMQGNWKEIHSNWFFMVQTLRRGSLLSNSIASVRDRPAFFQICLDGCRPGGPHLGTAGVLICGFLFV